MKQQLTLIESLTYDFMKNGLLTESDIVLDRNSLLLYIKEKLNDFIDKETDIEVLSDLLKQTFKQNIKKRGSRYVVSADEVVESIKYQLKS